MMAPDHISPDRRGDPARIRLRRRIEWIDTDAAGIYHWTTVCRLAEAAEAELHTALGIADITFGATPRVAVALNFQRPLHFNDKVEVDLRVDSVGRSSITLPPRRAAPRRR
jgi:acyl-CoA thioesterase FadM